MGRVRMLPAPAGGVRLADAVQVWLMGRHGEVAGRVKRNLLPPPGLSSTQMRPS